MAAPSPESCGVVALLIVYLISCGELLQWQLLVAEPGDQAPPVVLTRSPTTT